MICTCVIVIVFFNIEEIKEITYHKNPCLGFKMFKEPQISKCRVMYLPKVDDVRGNLTFIEQNEHIPFEIKRIYYLYDVPGGESRGGHAHKDLEQFIVAANGSFDVILDDGYNKERHHMNRSYYGLYLPNMIWRELDNFSSGSVCLVLASEVYDEDDYIRDYGKFYEIAQKNGQTYNKSK